MESCYDVAVIGGGASGMAAAVSAAEYGKKTIVIEKNGLLGRKLGATGNGRCNLMNRTEPRYYGDSSFALQALQQCDISRQEAFWHRYGLIIREESQGRVYPVTFQAASVVETLKTALKMNRVDVALHVEVTDILPAETGYSIKTSGGSLKANRVILATGGAASPHLGGTDSGYRLAEKLGYCIIPVCPSLCGLKTDQRSISGLNGIRVRGTVTVYKNRNEVHHETGEILFTDDGISGICVMQCARFVECCGADTAEINLTPDAFTEQSALMKEIAFRRMRFAYESPEFLFSGMVHRKMSYAVCKQAGIPLRGEKLHSLDQACVESAVFHFQHYQLGIKGTKGMDAAQVTAGGVSCESFHPFSMESKIHPGLFATGEILNVDGDCGGFNLMFAFATGIIAGENAAGILKNTTNIYDSHQEKARGEYA